MQNFPHIYHAAATSTQTGAVRLRSDEGIDLIQSNAPKEFGGPGDQWSPETLLVAAVVDCFVLSFRAIARASKLEWATLDCSASGTLDKVDGVTRFTAFTVTANLSVDGDVNEERALKILEKAEKYCLITNSMLATTHLQTIITRS